MERNGVSATIDTNNLKFVIFGSGHDYTLLDSGEGEKVFFSHPFVPLNSVNYAGQYYFEVPDENGDFFDAVKDDMAHITFDPALGTTFDTEGEIEVSVHYRREYIYPEETILVEKELKQTITVVNHGAITRPAYGWWGRWFCGDIYEDGYCFIRPANVNDLDGTSYCDPNITHDVTKVSSIYWRTTELGAYQGFITGNNVSDIEELKYADVSNVTHIRGLITNCGANPSLEPLEDWDVSNVTNTSGLFEFASNLSSLHGLEKWDVSKFTSLNGAFATCQHLEDFSPLENWDVSNVTDMSRFATGSAITSLEPFSKWNTGKVESIDSAFANCTNLISLHGLEDWDVSSLENISSAFGGLNITNAQPLSNWAPPLTAVGSAFYGCKLVTLEGLEKFDVSGVENFGNMFAANPLVSLHGVEDWDVSSATSFAGMFEHDAWISDVSALANWDTSSLETTQRMFGGNAAILSSDDFDNWDFSNMQNFAGMFQGFTLYYSEPVGKDVYADAYYYYDYEGNRYTNVGVQPLTAYVKDASSAEDWNVSGSGLGAFDDKWSNRPTWN